MKHLVATALAAALAFGPNSALAWGNTGHRFVGELAIKALPADVPAFLRTPQSALDVGEYSREPDRSKGSGKIHDSDRDPGHFVDVDDDGRILGGPTLATLPPTRAEYETALRAAGTDAWKAGYLSYSIIDRWQQLATDFAYWRVLDAAERNPAWAAHRAYFTADRRRREVLILATIGQLSHFVGDGSQPLHVTSHYDGWGRGPNPEKFSTARLHGPFESDLVQATVKAPEVAAKMTPFKPCNCAIETRAPAYLANTARLVLPFYRLEKAGGLAPGDPRGTALATQQIAVGASELRDVIVEAWRASATRSIGWKPVAVQDVVSGRIDPYPALYGID